MFERFRSRQRYSYSRWDGTQKLDDLDAEDILDALSEDYMRTGDLRKALERMMQQGFMGRDGMRRMGMQDLLDRLKQMRQQRMQRYNMSGVMDDIKEKLEHIKQLEREGIQRRLDNAGVQRPQSQAGDQGQQSGQDGQQQDGGPQGQEVAGIQGQSGQQGQEGQQGSSGQQRQMQGNSGLKSGQIGHSGQSAQSSQSGQSGESGESGRSGESGQQGGLPEGVDPEALRRVMENMAKKKLDFLSQLPTDPAGQIQQLSEYDFMD